MTRPFIVLKFGGTSVSTALRWAQIVHEATARAGEGLRPVVVCSALSGISNRLEALADAAAGGAWEAGFEAIVAQHRALGVDLGVDADVACAHEFDELRRLALGASLLGAAGPALKARIMALGELMSTKLGAAYFARRGVSCVWFDARDAFTAVDQGAGEARSRLSAVVADDADPALGARLAALGADVVLTQGFIARTADGETVLLGRGGSDTSAAYFAAKLGAVRCEIWTDVPGMFSADPRDVPTARLLKALDYEEAQEIATSGAKVLHPRCIAPVRRHGIPLEVRSTLDPHAEHTIIRAHAADDAARVKAVSSKKGVLLVSMNTPGMWQQVGFLADVFAVFKRRGLSIDLVSTSEMNVTASIDPAANVLDAAAVDGMLAELNTICRAELIGPCAAVSLVGRGIRAILHRIAPALEVFEERRVHLISQAASDLNLTFVVEQDQADRLVRELHGLLVEGEPTDAVFGPVPRVAGAAAVQRAAPAPWWTTERERLLALAGGETPLYVYHADTLRARARTLTALSAVSRVHYAVKANFNADVLRTLHAEGVAFECVSPGEVRRVRELFPDMAPDRILFTPNFAPVREYAFGFEQGVNVTLDNLHPLETHPELFRGREVFVRLDPGQGMGHHRHVHTGGTASKFGIDRRRFDDLLRLTERFDVRVTGVHAHVGSGIREPDVWPRTALFLAEAARRLPHVRVIDAGGGIAIPTRPEDAPFDFAALDAHLTAFRRAWPQYELWLEPGRFFVAEAGVLLTRVTQLKGKGERRYVGVDAGMNALIRPALYDAYHEIANLSRFGAPAAIEADVVGPICESGDVLGAGRPLPETTEGDVLLVATAGAYGRAMSSEYNLRPPPREVLL